jgi:hypothetical protein
VHGWLVPSKSFQLSSSTLVLTGHNHFPFGRVMDILLAFPREGQEATRPVDARLSAPSFERARLLTLQCVSSTVANVVPTISLSHEVKR